MPDIRSASDGSVGDSVMVEHRNAQGDKVLAIIRASSWGDFADCELRWYYRNIEGLRLPARGALAIGSAFHRGTGAFDQATLEAKPIPVAQAAEIAAEFIDNPTDEAGRPEEYIYDDDTPKGKAKDFSVRLTAKYCGEVAPSYRYAGVEIRCNALDVTTPAGVIRMTGTTDRIKLNSLNEWGIADFKTGARAVGTDGVAVTKGHGLQLGAYTLMSEQMTGKRLGAATIIGAQTASALRIGAGEVANPKLALVGTGAQPGMIEIFADTAKRGIFKPNPKSMLCSKEWCPAYARCIYHE